MVSFDLSFRSMLIEDIFEDEGSLCTEGIILWLTINKGSYRVRRVQVLYGSIRPCFDVSSGGGHISGRIVGAY